MGGPLIVLIAHNKICFDLPRYCIFQVGCPRLLEMGGVISLYKPTITLQPKVLGFVWCTLSHRLFPKAMDNLKNTVADLLAHSSRVVRFRTSGRGL